MSSEGKFRFSLLLAAAALAVPVLAAAQPTGDVRSRVVDGQGNPVAGIQVTLIKAGGKDNQQQMSDAEGNVSFNGLAGGVYIATTSPDGYAQVTCPGVRVVGQTRQLEIRLMPKDGPEPSSCKVVVEGP